MSAADFPQGEAGAAERQTILDAIPAIAWCKSPDGSNEFVNQRWQEYTGDPTPLKVGEVMAGESVAQG